MEKNLTDKEIALELTKAFLEHLSHRAKSGNASGSHSTIENVGKMYRHYYSTVSSVDKEKSKE